MFDKQKFSEILKKIISTYESLRDFSNVSGFNRTSVSKYTREELLNPPTPKILEKIANASKGITTYEELMIVCGYIDYGDNTKNIQDIVSYKINLNFNQLQDTINRVFSLLLANDELKKVSNSFNDCCNYIINDYYNDTNERTLSDFTEILINNERKAFNYLYISLLKKLHGYCNVPRIKDEVISLKKHLILKDNKEDITLCLNIISGIRDYYVSSINSYMINNPVINLYMCPVYGRISAGQPNWAEECIEGRLPIDPVLFDIVNPEEHFFLRVNGESMNKVIRNGAYALIRKQNYAEDGDIVVAIVNGDNEATLKKFKRFNEQFVSFEPMSSDESIKPINVDLKDTNVIILGKYIGKFEMNK